MKALIVYYSLNGATRAVARGIGNAFTRYQGPSLPAEEASADMEEVVDHKRREGALRRLVAAVDALLRRSTRIEPVEHSPPDYDLVLVGTPMWAGNLPSPMRAWLRRYGRQCERLALFVVESGGPADHVLAQMRGLAGKRPEAQLVVPQEQTRAEGVPPGVDEFVRKLLGQEND